jgi:hypothetical protein
MILTSIEAGGGSVKLAPDLVLDVEYLFGQPEFVGSTLKWDNRILAVHSLELWAAARNSLVKTAPPAAELPDNPVSELRAEAYADLFET